MKAKEVMSTEFIKVDAHDSVSSVFGKLKNAKHDAALVFDGKQYKGIFSKHRIIKTKMDPAKFKAGKMTKHVPVLNGEEDLKETARLIYASNMPVVPVIEKNKVIGVVRAIDVVNNLDLKAKRKKMSEVATTRLFVVHENDETSTAIRAMFYNAIERLPVVDREGNLMSIVCLHDILTHFLLMQQGKTETRGRQGVTQKGKRTIRAYGEKSDIRALPVTDFASQETITASMNDNVAAVIDYMNRFGISSIVITKGRKPVGIVTIRDLLGLFLEGYINK